MHITQYTDYALRVLIYLGARTGRATIAEIAASYQISRSHLMKVVNQLIQEGFVAGARGRGGGITLARPAAQIVIGDVVRCVEGNMELAECFGANNQCCITPACHLKGALRQALRAFMNVLDGYSLADLLLNADKLLAHMSLPDGLAQCGDVSHSRNRPAAGQRPH